MGLADVITTEKDLMGGATGSAVFSPDGLYRYALTRTWDPDKPTTVMVLLNPSTADAYTTDPTLLRCISFARTWGAGGLLLVNAFGLRATNPRELGRTPDPVGPDNDAVIANQLARVSPTDRGWVVCGWGNQTLMRTRAPQLVDLLHRCGATLWCLGFNTAGSPKHPLYVRGDRTLIEYGPVQPADPDLVQPGHTPGQLTPGVNTNTPRMEQP